MVFGVVLVGVLAREATADPGGTRRTQRALHDALVVTDRTLQRGGMATVHVTVTGALSLTRSVPVGGADVTLSLVPRAGAARRLATARTGADGSAVLAFRVPKVATGPHRLVIETRSTDGAGRTERDVEVEDGALLHLRTDRMKYRPGQTIRWRVTALGTGDARPVAGDRVEVVVRDPRGTAIWRGGEALPASGMIAGDLPLGDDLVTGPYRVTASLLETSATETIEVRAIQLPAFEVTLSGDAAAARALPGASLTGRVTARYRYGEAVRGRALLTADGAAVATGQLDEHGAMAFTWKVPRDAGVVRLAAEVVDGAQRIERAARTVEVGGRQALRVALVPERPELVAGEKQWFTAITIRGDEELAPAKLTIDGGAGQRVTVTSGGATRVELRAPRRGRWRVTARAVAARPTRSGWSSPQILTADLRGDGATAKHIAEVRLRAAAPVVRAVESIVAPGAPVVVAGTWRGARGPVIATLLRNGAPIAGARATIDRSGALSARLSPPAGSFGLATVRLIDVGWRKPRSDSDSDSDSDAEPEPEPEPEPEHEHEHEHEHVNVYLRPAELAVTITGETRHRPGQRASVKVAVRDGGGRPVAAALAASVIDERVLALGAPRPDLVTALRELDAIEDAASLGLTFADLLAAPRTTARDAALRAILDALPPAEHAPELVIPAEQRYLAEALRIARARTDVWQHLVAGGALGERSVATWRYRTELDTFLDRANWSAGDRSTPWGRRTTWAYAVELDPGLAFPRIAPRIARERLDALADALRAVPDGRRELHARRAVGLRDLVRRGAIADAMAIDPWGARVRVERYGGPQHRLRSHPAIDLVSAGADGAYHTGDDLRLNDVFHDLPGSAFGYGVMGVGAGGGGSGWGSIGTGRYGTIGHGSGSAGAAAPLRARFDETVLWRVGVPTAADGTADLTFDLSDSITGWQLAVEALAPGAVGAATARLETFLPLHLDAELPPRLATGDRYRIPIAVANHSGRAQTLLVDAELSGALRATGATSSSVELAAGATAVVHVAAEARAAGTGVVSLRLRAGGAEVDRVRRTLPVEPPGDLVRTVRTGRVENGRGSFAFTIPATAAAGSLRGQLRLFRGAADQALDGIEGMLQEPYGCFEQTSSTTYPNLLVLRLLDDAPRMGAVRKRARDLVARGYQRLISYEVAGGGFSWFGEAPANQVLTAYGLMEFVDMAAVYPVDPQLVERTRAWLLSKQRADGSWAPDASWLHDWSQVQGAVSTTAYIAWALAESGARGRELERAVAFLRAKRAAIAQDPYLVALWASAEGALGRKGRGDALALLKKQATPAPAKDGGTVYRAGGKTIFYASGDAADVQVTALAATALDRAGATAETRAALDWLWRARSPSYGWGTTQSTVLALRAAAMAAPKPSRAGGTLRVALDGVHAGSIDLASVGVPSLALAKLSPGEHVVTITGDVNGALMADLRTSWRGRGAPEAAAAGLAVTLRAPATPVAIGGALTMRARVRNPGGGAVPMPTVVIPVPPGFAADARAIDALRGAPGVSRVEDHGDSLAVYLLDLAPGADIELVYRVEATAACDVLQRPAHAYAYYTPEVRGQSAPLRLRARAP